MEDHDDREREVLDRIARGEFYTETDAGFLSPQRRADLVFEYNQTLPSDWDRKRELLVPPMSVAVGSPARVIREITDDDLRGRIAP